MSLCFDAALSWLSKIRLREAGVSRNWTMGDLPLASFAVRGMGRVMTALSPEADTFGLRPAEKVGGERS